MDERLEAKSKGDILKSDTYKLSLNSSFGNLGNYYSWLFDHQIRLQICVNGQLMLAMLIEKAFEHNISLIDANTDGCMFYVPVEKVDLIRDIVKQ